MKESNNLIYYNVTTDDHAVRDRLTLSAFWGREEMATFQRFY